jgi:predicted Zn-dependent peptidase
MANGLRIATDKMSEIESASINITVRVGSRYESKEINGVSHFLEHMAFKGTAKRTARQIAEEFDAIGGYFNAYTGRESTVYNVKLLKNDVSVGIDILADILQNSSFSEEEMGKELGVILQEIAQTNDTPDDIIFDLFQEAAFKSQSLGRSILGDEQTISTFNSDTLRSYVDSHYRAPNIVISCVGNIEHEELANQISDLFGGLKPVYDKQIEAGSYVGGKILHDKDLEQVQLLIGFDGVSYNNREDFYVAQVASSIIGGGMSSRLFQEVRENRGLAYSVGSFNAGYSDCGLFGIYAATSDKQVNELYEVIFAELDKASRDITSEELTRSKNQLKASILMSKESSSYRADELARNMAFYNRQISFDELIAKIDAIDKQQIELLIKKIITSPNPTIAAMGKLKDFTAHDVRNIK